MAEDINQDEDDIEEEEEEQGADAQQTLDDLTVLTGESDRLEDPDEQIDTSGEASEWSEPSATLSLSTIHTGSRPTDAELLANLIPEGDVIIEEEEIVRTQEEVGEELDDIEAENTDPDAQNRAPEETDTAQEFAQQPAAQEEPPVTRPPEEAEAPEEEEDIPDAVIEDIQPAAAAAAVQPEATPAPTLEPTPAPTEEPTPTETPEPLSAEDATGSEDTAITLDIDPGVANEVTISGVPSGATLSAGTDNGDGSWTISAADLEELTITPPQDSADDFSLTVSAGSQTQTIEVTVEAVADAPTAEATDVTGNEDTAIALDLSGASTDIDGSEAVSITISGVPSGASLSAGTDNGDGTWTLEQGDLAGLTITPPADFHGEIPLTMTTTATEDENGDTATATTEFTVTVEDTIDVTDVRTDEDEAVALNIEVPDGADTITISDMPSGASLSAGTDNGDGTWTVNAEDVSGLTLTPPADSGVDFTLQVEANGVSQELNVQVDALVDGADLNVEMEASGGSGTEIPLTISTPMGSDTDGSETTEIVITLPNDLQDATFSAGTDNGDGTWTFTPEQLNDLTITPPEGYAGEFNLDIVSTTTDTDPETGHQTQDIDQTTIGVEVTADGTFSTTDAIGDEDTAISLAIDPGTADSITISGVPSGATLSAGTDNGDGTWTLDLNEANVGSVSAEELENLTITPPDDSDADFTLTVDAGANSAELDVQVNAVADAPTASAEDVTGNEGEPIELDLTSALTDTDGSETLSLTVALPDGMDGATFSAGTDNGDGTWTFEPADLTGLTITPPDGFFGEIDLTLTATSTEANAETANPATATTEVNFTVTVESDGDFGASDSAYGLEDSAIGLTIDDGGADEITIAGVPSGASLSMGTDNGDGTWTIDMTQPGAQTDLENLTITPPDQSDADFDLTVTAEGEAESYTVSVTVEADADAPTVSANDASGMEDQPIPLDLTAGLGLDTDGSESLSVTISLPDEIIDATFNAGTDNGDGTWTMTAEDLVGLELTPPAGVHTELSGALNLQITATTTEEENGDTATTTQTFQVDIESDGDEVTFAVNDVTGNEDTAIPLGIEVGNATEIIISDVPSGATLSAGTDNGDGTWTLSAEEAENVTITPPENSDVDFDLSITATVVDEEGNIDTDTSTMEVNVLAVADAPDLDVESSIGDEDQPIQLNINQAFENNSGLVDTDGSETLSLALEITGIPEGAKMTSETEVSVDTANADGDGAIALDLDIGSVNSVTIDGVPSGATLSAGTDNGDGTWTLEAGDLEGLTITPAEGGDATFSLDVVADIALTADGDDFAASLTPNQLADLALTPPQDFNGDINLQVESTATETADAADIAVASVTTTASFGVTVRPVDDDPEVTIGGEPWDPTSPVTFSGSEDTDVGLDLNAQMGEGVTESVATIIVGGVPSGAELSVGTDNGDGTWTINLDPNSDNPVSAEDLSNLTLSPEANWSGDATMSVTAISTDGGVDVGTFNLSIDAVVDDPTLDLNAGEAGDQSTGTASGTEDGAIELDISAGLTDTDGSETLSVTISGVPSGAELSAGTDNGDGTWTLEAGDLDGLTVTPPANSDDDFQLSVSATSTESSTGESATVTGTIDVSVAADADAPTLTVDATAEGTEDNAINLDIASGLTDTDGSESLSITISGVPSGASLNAGTDNGDGTWTLEAGDLDGLQVTPPDDFSGAFDLTVSATSTEADGGDTATTTGTITVDVDAVADDPTLTLDSTSAGTEDSAIALDIDAGLSDSSETLSVTISGVPSGAELSAGTDNGDGTWTLSGDDLDGLTVTPPADSDADFQLTVTATSTDGDDTASTSGTIDVSVAADADAPTLTLDTTAEGTEDNAINLDIASGLTDTDGSESLSITISGVPSGATLNNGTDNGDGTWTLDAGDLAGLQVTPPDDFSGAFDLTVSATSTEADGGDTATTTGTITVDVAADADDPTLTVDTTAAGLEDSAIALDIDAGVTDSSESLSVTISGVPSGATLSAGTDNGDGTWTLTGDDLDGLTITPPEDSNVDFQLGVTATSTDGDDTASVSSTIDVDVTGVADAADLSAAVGDSTTDGETTTVDVNLDITAALTDTDGSETLSITIEGMPSGASLSAGTDNGDGTWSLAPEDLDGLELSVPNDYGEGFDLTVNATTTEDDGDTETVSQTLSIDNPDTLSDGATLTLSDSAGTEDGAIGLNIDAGLVDTDGSESLSVTISGVPSGASLSAGTDNGDGTWTLEPGDLTNLTVTPPADSDVDFQLTVEATATETSTGDTSTTTGTIDVSVAADADAPTLTLDSTADGTEDTAINLDIASGLTDTDGSESLSITISGVPSGASLNNGTDNGDGTWTLDAGDLAGLQVTPPEDFSGAFDLTVSATSTEADGGDTATTTGTITVDVAADADDPTLTVDSTAEGLEDSAIALDIDAGVTDSSETLSVTISGVPSGAELSAGTDNGDGTWTLDAGDLDGLTVTPPENSNEDFQLTVTATSTDGGDTATTTSTIDVDVTGVADDADLSAAVGDSSTDGTTTTVDVELDITAALTDTDGSETLSVTIEGMPSGAELSAGTDNGDGSWTLTPEQLDGLELSVPNDYGQAFDLTVNAITTEDDGDVATVSQTLNVGNPDTLSDGATLTLSDSSGTEDGAIGLNIDAGLVDTDGSESLSITISGVPSGASLSAGTDNGDGTWTLEPGDLANLTVTPPADSDVDFQLTVEATATESLTGDTSTTTGTIDVSVAADADAPTLTLDTTAEGTEDNAINLDIASGLTDTDGSESLSITISGVPSGAELSAGTDNGDGTWSLSAGDLDGLQVTPPDDFSGSFDLTVAATSTEADGGDTATTTGTITVDVDAVADDPTLTLDSTSTGTEDTAIALDIDAGVTDSSESLSVTISGVPSGAELSAGTDNGDGTWTLSGGDLDGLTVTPPADSDGDFQLTVTATSTDGDDTATTSGTIDVSVAADADAPTLTLDSTASGTEDNAIGLDIASGLTDTDGSESLSITISGVPSGASLSAGTDNGDGTWSLDAGDLDGLSVTPPADSDVDFQLTVTATSTEADGGDTATTTGTIDVSVAADADAPTLTLDTTAEGTEDTAINLDIASGLTDTDGSESLSITISGVPSGAELSAGTDNGDGTWTLDAGDLDGLQVTPPEDFSGAFDLSVTATSTEADGGDTATTTGTITVDVAADADDPVLTIDNSAAGTEDNAIALDIDAGVSDSSETVSITIDGVPSGASLSAGTDNGDGTWTLDAGDLDGLTVTPPADSDADFQLTVTATSTDGDDTATTSGTIDVSVAADADAPTLTLDTSAEGTEDNAINLDIASGLTDTDGSESLSITISGVPSGAELSAGTDNGDGTWTLDAGDLDGLQVTPPEDFSGSFDLSVTATATEGDGGDTATTSGTITVDVAADADDPTLTLDSTSAGTEDTAIALDIDAGVTDSSESLSVTISGVPSGAELSAGTDNGDGTWTLSGGDLDGLTVTPPADSDADFQLTVTATSTDGDDTATTSGTIDVSVAADADAPTLTLDTTAEGTEDNAINLDIASGLTDTDGSESLSITISGVPSGAELSAGTDNGDGTWSLDAGDLDGLQVTPPDDFSGAFDLTVSATSTEADGGDTATTTGTITVDVAADADDPTLTLDSTTSGTEDTAIALDIDAGVTDASEDLSITISGVPSGAELSAGTDNGDGTWTLDAQDLGDLTITPPADSDADFQLTVTATSTDGDDTATTSGTIDVSVAADADAPTLTLDSTAQGEEDSAISLDISSGLTDTDGSESLSITISGVPSGASLNAGTDNGDGTWSLDAGDLDGLQVTPPDDYSGEFDLTVTATSTEADGGDTATTTGTITVDVDGGADAPTLVLDTTAEGTEDNAIALDIDAGLTDSSETLSVTISGVPSGASLSAGTDNGDGTWTLDAEDLGDLTITPPADSDADFQLSVTATSSDGEETASTTGTIDVSVAADADAPTLTLDTSAEGNEDSAINLDIASGLTDTDGSESLSITISGVPSGAELSAGTDNGDGTWSLDAGDLDGLQVTPPDDFSGSFDLSVTATATEGDGGDTATTTGTITVDVDAVADDPTLTMDSTSAGTEDTAIALDIDAGVTDASESVSITIDGVPSGASLSAGTDNGDGTWTLDAGDLDGLTVTPPADSDADFQLTVTATSTDGDDTATTSGTIDVSVAADADAPTLTLDTSAEGTEDNAINLDIASGLTDTDGSESLSITISGVPSGAELSAGTDNGDGTWTLDAGDLDGLQVTPPEDFSGSFDLSVTATATEGDGGDTATTSGTITVDVAADADDPTLTLDSTSAGTEDTAIALDIDAGVTDSSETVSITIDGVPSGASLSAGTDNGDGTWTLDAGDLDGLTVTPPADSDADFQLTVTATSTDGDDTATTSGTIDVSVAADADAPTLTLDSTSEGNEDTAIDLDIASGLTDTDGSESLSITISGVPSGAELSAGTDNGDGTWTLNAGQLDGLQVTPPEDFSGSFDLSVTATATEADGGDTATTSGTITVDVAAVADDPTLEVESSTSGTEDTAIALDIDAGVTDSSESVSITISGVPSGAELSAGTDNGDGTWTLDADDLGDLTVTPPADSDADFQLTVTATSTDGDDTATTSGTIDVSVAADADAPTLTLDNTSSGAEDTAIDLDIASGLTDTDGSESLSITISGVPSGAELSAGTDNGDGTWTLDAGDLDGLQVTPPDDFSGSFDLSVTATATEGDGGDTATTSGTITVDVAAVADDPTLTVDNTAEGNEDSAIALDIDAGVTDSSESLSVSISGVPSGASLSAGTDNGDGTWTLDAGDLDGLTVTPPADSNDDFQLTVTATSTDGSDTATTTSTIDVDVTGVADAPTLSVEVGDPVIETTGGTETDVTIDASNYDSTDSGFSVSARSIDDDGNLTDASVDNVSTGGGGFGVSGAASGPDYQLGYDQEHDVSEQLIIDFDNDVTEATFDFGRLYADEGGSDANEEGQYEIYRDGVKVGEGSFDTDSGNTGSVTISADDGGGFDQIVFMAADDYSNDAGVGGGDGSDFVITGVEFTNVEGGESTVTYPLDITSGLTDTDGSESLSITVADLPDGATLSAGTDNGDGTWTLSSGDLDGLEITVTGDDPGQAFDLTVTATATEDDGDTATVSTTASASGVNVDSEADGATLDVSDASGTEDTAISLDIDAGLVDTDGSESLSITISDVPSGASLSAGTDNGDGTWTLDAGDLDGLTVTPPADSDGDFTLSVSATSTESSTGDTSTTTGTIDVSVAADADAPTMTLDTTSEGTEDTAIDLDITAGLTDTDGSESLSITIADVPSGASLSAGTDNGDGTWTLDAGDLDGLQITPPDDFSGSFDLSVTATATEGDGGDTATTTGTISVDVAADADDPTLTVDSTSAGTEDTAIALDIDAGVSDSSETVSITIDGVPSGASLSAGTDNGDGTWTLDAGDLDGLTVTPPADSDADFQLTVTATSTDGDDTATTSGTIDVSVAADADAPTLTLDSTASGTEDGAIDLDIASSLTDTDGSESLSITISGVPSGASLNGGTDNGDGTWTLDADDLDGLQITPPADSDGDFQLSVTATSTEGDGGDTATTSGTIDVSVAADADAATLSVSDAAGTEDTAIALDIDAGLSDTDGSESMSITISGVPSGASLNGGTDNGDGTWTLDADDLDGLEITPPADSNVDFQLGVTVTTTEGDGGDTATVSGTIDVDVTGDADAATLSASLGDDTADVSGVTYDIDVTAALTDTDGSESLSVTISNVPGGVSFDAGTDNGNGSWTFEAGDLSDLAMTVPDGTDAFDLTVSAISSEDDGDTATTTATISVDATDTSADEASLDVSDAAGNEDTAIALDIDAGLTDTDGSESMSITISGVPSGASLNAGTDNGDGTWTLDAGDLDGLTVTPPADSNEDFSLSVSVTTTEASTGDTATTTGTIDVDVTGVADAPSLSVTVEHAGETSGQTDIDVPQAISDAASGDDSVIVSGVPSGATLNNGTDNGDGTWTLDAGDLDGLTVMPADGSTDTISLSFEVPGTESAGDTLTSNDFSGGVSGWGGDAESSNGQMMLEGDATTSQTFDFGVEHAGQTVTISFDMDAQNDWEESGSYQDYFNVSINGTEVLETSEESATSQSFTVTLDENGQVTVEMSTDTTASSERVMVDNFEITAGDDWSSTLASADLDVEPEAANTVYDLNLVDIQSSLTDTDGSETLSITVSGLPSGAELTAGTDNGDGSWTLTPDQAADLEILVPDGAGDFDLTVAATATEDDGDTNTVTQTVTVSEPDSDADGATIDTTDASGNEDTAIALDIDVTQVDTDGSETMSITLTDVPSGASLSAGTDNGDGTWSLDAGDLDGLTITPPADSNADFTLGVSVTTTETSSGDTTTNTSTLDVDVTGVADAPTLSASVTFDSTVESATDVGVPSSITDAATSGTEVTVSGVPSGASLSSGTDNGDGTWTLDPDDLSDLTVTPADGETADIDLSFEVTGSGGSGDTLFSDDFTDGVNNWGNEADAYNGFMDGGSMEIAQNETASQTFDFGVEHAGQTVVISFDSKTWGGWDDSGSYQDYFEVTANGTEVSSTSTEGEDSHSITVTLDENGQLALDLHADATGSGEGIDIDNFVITAGDDWSTSLASDSVTVDIEEPGYVYDLDITSALTDTDGSESLSITVSSVPSGATLSAGTDNGDGTWSVASGDLSGLQITVPEGTADFDLGVAATATENDGDTNSVSTTISVSTPDTVAEDANLTTSDASGSEDRAIALDIDASLTDTDGSETLSITISGVPSGAELSAGTDNGDGTWTLGSGDLDGLTVLPPEDSSTDFELTVSATTTETTTGDTSTVTSTIDVTVDGVADAPDLSVSLGDASEVGGGLQPVSYWQLDEDSGNDTLVDAVGDNDGSPVNTLKTNNETGVFDGAAEFSGGGKSSSEEYIEVPHSDDLKPENGTLTLWFNADDVGGGEGGEGDMFTLASSDSSGYDDGGHFGLFIEDGQLRLRMQSDDDQTDITGGSVSTGDWNQVTVTWGDDGANVYLNGELVASDSDWTDGLAGNENPWTFGANQWSSSDNTANNMSDFFDGHMDDIAIYDTQLTADDVEALFDDGVEDAMSSGEAESLQYPLDITASLSDTDGSESMAISVEGLPDGAVLSAGTDNGDGTWSVDSGDLDGLTLTVPADADDFLLSVNATVTDEGGDTRTATEMVQVDVGDDGFDAGTVGTDSADTITGTSGDDTISGEDGNDSISAGDGDDTVLGGAGDDDIDGGAGDDVIDAGAGDDTIDSGAGDDHVMGGQGDDLFIFGAGDGADYFQGGDGWSDTVQLEGVDGGPGGDSGWTLQVDEGAGYTETESGIEFDAEASGVITLADGSELTFDGVEKLEW